MKYIEVSVTAPWSNLDDLNEWMTEWMNVDLRPVQIISIDESYSYVTIACERLQK